MNYLISNVLFIVIFTTVFCVHYCEGHGMLMDPVNRGSAWRFGYNTPINYDDNQNFCGGFFAQHYINKGKCGICGDNYALKQPRPSENGGTFGTGTIVRTYAEGQNFTAAVLITAHHGGYFKFSLCPLEEDDIETEECFNKHPIYTANGEDEYYIGPPSSGDWQFNITLSLPKNITCDHCSLRWHWRVANNWGFCSNGTGALGCGIQETFRTCSDIRIIKKYNLIKKFWLPNLLNKK